MRKIFRILLSGLITLGLCSYLTAAQADTIKLRNGRTVEGNVVVVGGGYVVVERNGTQVSLPQSEVIPPDLNKMMADAQRVFADGEGDVAQADRIARKVLLWDRNHAQAKALTVQIRKLQADELARAEADKAARAERIEEARNAMDLGLVQRARTLVDAVLSEDAESSAALALLPQIEEAERAAAAQAESAKAAREQAILDAQAALSANDVGKAINAARPVIMEMPEDARVQSLLQGIGKAAGDKLANASTATLQAANTTQQDLQVLVNQANTLAQGGGAQISTMTLSGILTDLADFIAPPRPENYDETTTATLSAPTGDASFVQTAPADASLLGPGDTTGTLTLPAGEPGAALAVPAEVPPATDPALIIPSQTPAAPAAVTPAAPAAPAGGGFPPPPGAIGAGTSPVVTPAVTPAAPDFPPPAGAVGGINPVPGGPTATPANLPPPPGAAVTPSTPALPVTPALPSGPAAVPAVPGQ